MNKNVDPADKDPNLGVFRCCFRDPIQEIFRAAELLSEAVDAHLAGDRCNAGRLIEEANIQKVWDWTESIWGKYNHEIHRIRPVNGAPLKVCKGNRDKRAKPNKKLEQELIDRDGRHCQFCGIPLIHAEIRKAMRKDYSAELSWGNTNDTQHAAFQCMWMQFDHIIPHSRRGATDLDNLIITCSACNYGRNDATLEEVGLIDPRIRSETKPTWDGYATWDGLERFRGR